MDPGADHGDAASARPPDRPPSVDALARSLADVGLPHPLLVEAARAALAAGDPTPPAPGRSPAGAPS